MTAVHHRHGPTLPGALASLTAVIAIIAVGCIGWTWLFAGALCR